MNNYARGANFERTVKADLEAKGYLVIRAAGSHGIMDLVAFKEYWTDEGAIWFIQAKTNGKMSPPERRELFESAFSRNAWAVIASRPKRGVILYERLFIHGTTQRVEIFA
jgi:Holliday junction resolvase